MPARRLVADAGAAPVFLQQAIVVGGPSGPADVTGELQRYRQKHAGNSPYAGLCRGINMHVFDSDNV